MRAVVGGRPPRLHVVDRGGIAGRAVGTVTYPEAIIPLVSRDRGSTAAGLAPR